MFYPRLAAAALAAIAAAPAQQTVVVQGSFLDYYNALATVNHGDRIVVRAGSYWAAMSTKGITVECDPGVDFTVLKGFNMGCRDLPAGTWFVMRGGTVTNFEGGPPLATENCRGGAVFESVSTTSSPSRFASSASVALHDCRLRGVSVIDSTVSISRCAITGFAGSPLDPAALLVERSEAVVADSTIGGPSSFDGSGVWLDQGRLIVAGDASTRIEASGAAPAIKAASGTLWIDPRVTLVSAANPKIQGPVTVLTTGTPWSIAPAVASGQTLRTDTYVDPGSLLAVLAGWPVIPSPISPLGSLWVTPSAPVLDIGTVPASGSRTVQVGVPALGSAVPLVIQGIALYPSGVVRLGAPATVVVN